MRLFLHPAAALICSLSVLDSIHQAHAASAPLDDKSAAIAAKTFLAAYIKSDSKNVAWMAKTPLATAEFKAAFKKAMAAETVDADPVLHAQDIPSTPFKAESATVKGNTATVLVAAKFGTDPYKLKVTLVSQAGHWLVSKTTPVK